MPRTSLALFKCIYLYTYHPELRKNPIPLNKTIIWKLLENDTSEVFAELESMSLSLESYQDHENKCLSKLFFKSSAKSNSYQFVENLDINAILHPLFTRKKHRSNGRPDLHLFRQ